MSLQHKKVARIGDEYSCAFCGKMWSIDDQDPPSCSAVVAIVGKGVRTWHSMPRPNMQNLPREGVTDGEIPSPEEIRAMNMANLEELELSVLAKLEAGNLETQDEYYDRLSMAQKKAFAIASTNPGCSQRSVAQSSVFAYEYGKGEQVPPQRGYNIGVRQEDAMYVIGYETPQGWKGCAIYAKTGERAMRYFMGAFGHRLKPEQCNALVLDKVLGTFYPGSLTIPHAELRTVVLKVNSRHNTATGIKYELLSPTNFRKAVNP